MVADENGFYGLAIIIVGDKQFQVAIPDNEHERSDPERTMMLCGMMMYQATNMKPTVEPPGLNPADGE